MKTGYDMLHKIFDSCANGISSIIVWTHKSTYLQAGSTGGLIGILVSFSKEHAESILLTFVLGFVGAFAAGLAKFILSLVIKDRNPD